MKIRFVSDTDAHYLWSGFVKKLESLESAGVVPQRFEAFEFYGTQTALHFGSNVIGSGQWP